MNVQGFWPHVPCFDGIEVETRQGEFSLVLARPSSGGPQARLQATPGAPWIANRRGDGDQHALIAAFAVPAHVFDPASAFLIVSEGEAIKALADRLDPGEAQHTALETAYPVCAKVPTIKQHRNIPIVTTMRAERPASSRLGKREASRPPADILGVFHGKARPEKVFEKSLRRARAWSRAIAGTKKTQCCAQRMSSCGLRERELPPRAEIHRVRNSGNPIFATSTRRLRCPAPIAPSA